VISIKIGRTDHGAFFEQPPEYDIIFLDSFDGIERIKLHKGGNTKPRVMEKLEVREKNLHYIIILFWHIFIGFNKDGIKK
jgi:hypothetical protein